MMGGWLALAIGLGLHGIAAQESQPVSESSNPVIFWAHYMPMVPHGHLHAHPHAEGNHDAWPLNSQHILLKDDYKEDIRQALASGINGFQMLAIPSEAVFEAAREIRTETGQLFYIAPQWLAPRDLEKAVQNIAAFTSQHAGDPHVYRVKGKPVHFFWNPGSEKFIIPLKERLKKDGINVLLVPTFRPAEITASKDWLLTSGWEAVQTWTHGELTTEMVDAIVNQLRMFPPDQFYFVPGIASGYDSSNRTGQAIHVPANGLNTLVNSLRQWLSRGFRQLMLVTWNDPQESLEIPSSRNIWGHNTILQYFHSLSETGKSPFKEPRVVVSYPVECLLGDSLFFQVLVLPERDATIEWRTKVKLKPFGSASTTPPIELSGGAKESTSETLVELSTTSTGFMEGVAALQPYVTIERKNKTDKTWKPLYQEIALPPITLRYNLVQYPVPYSIDLEKMAKPSAVSLSVQDARPLTACTVKMVDNGDPIQRLVLCEGTRSLGVFRPQITSPQANESAPIDYRDIFLKIEASREASLILSVRNGLIHDLYSPYPKLGESVKIIEAVQATFPAHPPGGEYRTRVARMSLNKESTISLRCAKSPENESIIVTLNDLEKGMATRTVIVDGRKVTISLVLTTDASEPNINYPLGTAVQSHRHLPLYSEFEGERVLTAWAWHESGRVSVSPPTVLRPRNSGEITPVQWIDTKGTYDSFIDGASEISLNPFGASDVRTGQLPRDRVPYFHLPLNEGAGARLNDRGTSQQAGRAYLESDQAKREQGQEPEDTGRYQWIEKGWRGPALQLGDNTRIRFRSKSAPMGSETSSIWVGIKKSSLGAMPGWSQLQSGPFTLTIQPDGTLVVRFTRGGAKAEKSFTAEFSEGWNHLTFVYDLATVRFYLNGVEIGTIENVKPVYQRTHQSPAIGFTNRSSRAPAFTGQLDEIQIIGAGIDAAAIKALANGGVWRNSETKP